MMTQKAELVQVYSRRSELPKNCIPVQEIFTVGPDVWAGGLTAVQKATILAREESADIGANALVISSVDFISGNTATVRGTALYCDEP